MRKFISRFRKEVFMSRLTDIKAKINVLEGGAFQELCDALLARKGYDKRFNKIAYL